MVVLRPPCRTSDGKPTNKIGIEKSYQSQKTIKTASYDVAKGTTAMDQCDRGWRKISGKGELNKKKRGGSRCFVPFGGRDRGREGGRELKGLAIACSARGRS